jgi:hypothetical protein
MAPSIEVNFQTGLVVALVALVEELVVVMVHHHTNHQAFQQVEVLVVHMVLMQDFLVLVVLVALHTTRQATHQEVLLAVVLSVEVATNRQHTDQQVVVMIVQHLVKLLAIHLKPMLPGLDMVLM